jgi:hypothetical protein
VNSTELSNEDVAAIADASGADVRAPDGELFAGVTDLVERIVAAVDELPHVPHAIQPQAERIAEFVTRDDWMHWGAGPRLIAIEALKRRLDREGRLPTLWRR